MASRRVGVLLIAAAAILTCCARAGAQPVDSWQPQRGDESDATGQSPAVGRGRNPFPGRGRQMRRRRTWRQLFGVGGPDEAGNGEIKLPKPAPTETLVGIFVIMLGGLFLGVNL